MSFLNEWKWYIFAAVFLIYSIGVWDVSGTYAVSRAAKAELTRIANNDALSREVTNTVAKALESQRKLAAEDKKELYDEILKDPVYKSCRVTDGVRKSIQRKLDAQP